MTPESEEEMSELTIIVIRIVLAVSALGFAAVILRAHFLRKDKKLHYLAMHWTLFGLAALLVELLITAGSRGLSDHLIFGFAVVFYFFINKVAWHGSKRYARAYRER